MSQFPTDQRAGSAAAIQGYKESLASALRGVNSFKGSIQGLPRLTTRLNQSRSNLVHAMNDIALALEEGVRLADEATKLFLEGVPVPDA